MKKETLNIGLFVDTFFPMVDGVIMVVDNYVKLAAALPDFLTGLSNLLAFCRKMYYHISKFF